MSQATNTNLEIEDDDMDDNNDYIIVIDANGELRGIVVPENLVSDPPGEIREILDMYGIENIYEMIPRTLH